MEELIAHANRKYRITLDIILIKTGSSYRGSLSIFLSSVSGNPQAEDNNEAKSKYDKQEKREVYRAFNRWNDHNVSIFLTTLNIFDIKSYCLIFKIKSRIDVVEEGLAQNNLFMVIVYEGYVSTIAREDCVTRVLNVHQESFWSHSDNIVSEVEIDVAEIFIILVTWTFGLQAEFVTRATFNVLVLFEIMF